MPKVDGPTRRTSGSLSLLGSMAVGVAIAAPLYLLAKSGDNETAKILIDVNNDGVLSPEEESRAQSFLDSASPEQIKKSIQLRAMQKVINQMRQERENQESNKKTYHYNEIY